MRTRLSLLLALGLLVALACTCPLTGLLPQTGPSDKPAEEPKALVGERAEGNQPDTGARPARSIEDVENAVVKVIAEGTWAWLEEGGDIVRNIVWGGSGFLIDPSGLVVTNNHVTAGAATLKVYIAGDFKETFPARVIAASECMDLAVLQVEGGPFPVYLEWYTGPVEVGMDVYAAGFPILGDHWEFTLTKGIISKTRESGEASWSSMDFTYLHDARIRGGNSGGPLITEDGRVVGINYAGADELDVNIAIPAELARPVVETLRTGQPYRWTGISGYAIQLADADLTGIWVESVQSGSPADLMGIRMADIIVEIENIRVALEGSMKEYCDILASRGPDDPIKIKVLRWETGEILEGTLNVSPLQVVGHFRAEGETAAQPEAPPASSKPSDQGDWAFLTDDTQAIGVSVPQTWTQDVDGRLWSGTWTKDDGSTYDFVAARIVAAPNIDAFINFGGPGLWIAASRDFGKVGGYLQLLDATRSWFESCTFTERGTYDDEVYEGGYYIWERCGSQKTISSVMLVVRPKADPTAFLMMVNVSVGPQDDVGTLLPGILNSFDVIGALP